MQSSILHFLCQSCKCQNIEIIRFRFIALIYQMALTNHVIFIPILYIIGTDNRLLVITLYPSLKYPVCCLDISITMIQTYINFPCCFIAFLIIEFLHLFFLLLFTLLLQYSFAVFPVYIVYNYCTLHIY